MSKCINKSHPDFIKLQEETKLPSIVLEMRISKWQEVNNSDVFPTSNEVYNSNEVNQSLKSIQILSSDKGKQVFEKGKKSNWDLNKILTELQISKEQRQLILDLNITNREEIIVELASNYSYTIEINTAKDERVLADMRFEGELPNTDYYKGMTVPGGTNYTEQEIATTAITPSIKGHAQFSTDKGIGWFRSDDKDINIPSIVRQQGLEAVENYKNSKKGLGDKSEKTRRILEVQSDWGQKQRKQSDPNMMINFNETKFLQDLQYAGDLKIECD